MKAIDVQNMKVSILNTINFFLVITFMGIDSSDLFDLSSRKNIGSRLGPHVLGAYFALGYPLSARSHSSIRNSLARHRVVR